MLAVDVGQGAEGSARIQSRPARTLHMIEGEIVFANRFRSTTLALAAAAVVAVTLLTPAPAAASDPAVTGGTTTIPEFDPSKLPKLPVADGEIRVVKAEWKSLNPRFTFRVTNHGPGAASFKVQIIAAWLPCVDCSSGTDIVEQTVTLANGQYKEYQVVCKGPGCVGATGHLTTSGSDPNLGNNADSVVATSSPPEND